MTIIDLINNSKCLTDEEKLYWVDLLQIMNLSQIDRLKEILECQNKKLEELNKQILTKFWK